MRQYSLNELTTPEGWFYLDIRKGMPGLKQVGRIANERLTSHLEIFDYRMCRYTPGLRKHDSIHITFLPIVDDLGVKYMGKKNVKHLLLDLRSLYIVTEDWGGSLFNGLMLKWNYMDLHVNMPMPIFILSVLHSFYHPTPPRWQHRW